MKPTFSNMLFLRSYAGIVLGIVAVALLLDLFLASLVTTDTEGELRSTYSPLFTVITDTLLSTPSAHRAEALAGLSRGWDFPAQLVPLADFASSSTEGEALDFSDIAVFFDADSQALLYQRLPGTEDVLALGPLPLPGSGGGINETWIISAYYGLIALVLLLWIRPFSRDLTLLRKAAANFGKADFATRVQLPTSSSILPVANSFNAMAERIEYLISVHKDLTNAVSHELRTPLARFKFTMEILARTADPAQRQHYLEEMKIDVQELETLIDEMLTYARLGEHNLVMRLEEVDLKHWLERELRVYERGQVAVTCSFSCIPPDASNYIARINPDLMARALHNIVRNGLRYSKERISILLYCNGNISLRICDDGPGVPPGMQANIFEPFTRLETSRDRLSGGYGLGLAIASRILQRHGGHVSVHNCEPHGACFIMEWPRQTPDEQAAQLQHKS
ncbi:MAG TPA: ATP-binding protein [Hyphomicrobiales bacterium]|nr:ATP-binding protein [Hyphomicrobiales bacterium]